MKYTLIDLAAGGSHWRKQPRDGHGRWTDTGGLARSAAKAAVKAAVRKAQAPSVTSKTQRQQRKVALAQRKVGEANAPKRFHWDRKINDATKRIVAKAAAAEPRITADLQKSIGSGRLEGLDYRLKAPDSLARKIQSIADEEFEGDVAKAEADIKDAVRYTAIWDRTKIVGEADKMLADLRAKGHKVSKIKNYLGHEAGPMGYRGVNVQMVSPTGHLYELQFHTPESFAAKMGEGHQIYEEYRVLPPNSAKRRVLAARSEAFYAARVPPIPGAEALDGK